MYIQYVVEQRTVSWSLWQAGGLLSKLEAVPLRQVLCMNRVTTGGEGGGCCCCCHVCQGESRLRDMSLCQRLLKKIWRRLYGSFAPSVFLKGWECGWELSDLKEDYHLLGDERQVEGAFLFGIVLFILSLIQEFLLLCVGKNLCLA